VGLGDVLFGRKRLKSANLDRLFALSTAQITLPAELGLKPDGVAAVVFKPLSAGEFMQAERMNAFFIIPTSVKSSIHTLFLTHPPMEKRIEALQRMESQLQAPVAAA